VTLHAKDPDLWDAVFSESGSRARFVRRLARRIGPKVLDVGCATGSLCALLRRQSSTRSASIKIADLLALRVERPERHLRRRRHESVQATSKIRRHRLSWYNLLLQPHERAAIRACLLNFSRHLSPDGRLVIEVLNAIAFISPRPFQRRTQHHLWYQGKRTTATIRHELDLRRQLMTEQVTWRFAGRTSHRDPPRSSDCSFHRSSPFTWNRQDLGRPSWWTGSENPTRRSMDAV
jgi:2-polyprenyl-3-methyl-5-hydroxy-6-metoxy-1,4-benzoquinol methylase